MSVCSGIKRDGGRCTVVVTPEQQYCYQHDPHRATERKRNASRGGKSRTNRELAALKAENTDIRKQLLEGKILPGVAAVAVQSLNADVRIVAIGLKVSGAT